MSVTLPDAVKTLGDLVQYIKTQLITSRHDMFASGDGVRPGVLVLVNDVDWELEGTKSYRVCNQDTISFISTLHGG